MTIAEAPLRIGISVSLLGEEVLHDGGPVSYTHLTLPTILLV